MKTIHNKSAVIVTLTLTLPLLAVSFAGCGKKEGSAAATGAPAARALPVRALLATNRVFERRLTVQGTLEAKNFASVAARVVGNLDAIWVDEGDAVKAGETRLFQIDPVGLSNALSIAEQALDVAKAGFKVAEASAERTRAEARKVALDYERYARLHKDGKVSNNEYETADTLNQQARAAIAVAEAQVDLAGSQVNQAEAARSIARKNLDDSLTLAPITGLVSLTSGEPGEQMAVGRTVLQIVDLGTIEAAAYLPAQYYPDVIPGETPFRLEVNGRPAGTHAVGYRSPTINPALRTFEIKGQVEHADGLAVPGSMAAITIVFETRRGIGVPAASLLHRSGRQVVFVVREGKAVQVAVTTGFQNEAWAEILTGLQTGEQVVTEGQTQLQDGEPVEVL